MPVIMARDAHEPAHKLKFLMDYAQFMVQESWFVPIFISQPSTKRLEV